jgi:hypothetical protein
MFDRYQKNAEGDDLHSVVELAREQRAEAHQKLKGAPRPASPTASPEQRVITSD